MTQDRAALTGIQIWLRIVEVHRDSWLAFKTQ